MDIYTAALLFQALLLHNGAQLDDEVLLGHSECSVFYPENLEG